MIIRDDRVKSITAYRYGHEGSEDFLTEFVLREIAFGIIEKLKEFNKVKISHDGPYVRAECTLQIIVPRVNERSTRTIPPGT